MSEPVPKPRRRRGVLYLGRGDAYVWLLGGATMLAATMIVALLSLVLANGLRTFWPRRIVEITLQNGQKVMGEVTRVEKYRDENGALRRRRLLRTGNYDLYGDDFKWVADQDVATEAWPKDAWLIERVEWGPAIGRMESIEREGQDLGAAGRIAVADVFRGIHPTVVADRERILAIQRDAIGDINRELDEIRLSVRKVALKHGEGSAAHKASAAATATEEQRLTKLHESAVSEIDAIQTRNAGLRVVVRETGGEIISERAGSGSPMLVSQIVRAYPANADGLKERVGVYLSRWGEFLTAEPREANTEGGVLPAIFGTFMMTVIMSLAVAPFGVVAALYLREYAKQGVIVSSLRVAVNNLAGVPSIVFGVFGLGFFCYGIGGKIDSLLYPERLPAPTYGTGGILWASLTLALLTVPVVIVAAEEALGAVPRSMREGSIACGASRWQTIRRIMLPHATPGIITGLILAMARGAGEVAPLMLTGAVKLAPELPIDGHFPYLHLERSFMHLGFHIYDVGFQSRNSEAGKPMVFTTTLLLIGLIVLLNVTAIRLRSRLRERYRTATF